MACPSSRNLPIQARTKDILSRTYIFRQSLGLFDLVVGQLLEDRLAALDTHTFALDSTPVDPGDSHAVLTDYLKPLIPRALDALAGDERLQKQTALCNRVIGLLDEVVGEELAREAIAGRARRLLSIRPVTSPTLERPDTPLGLGCLLTGTRLDPSLVSQLRKEIQTADRVDVLCSFIKWSGIRILEEALHAFAAKPGARLRFITTSYLGATDLKAIDLLHSLPAEIRVSYAPIALGCTPRPTWSTALPASVALTSARPTSRTRP